MKYVLYIVWMLGLLAGAILTAVGANAYGTDAVEGAAAGFFILWFVAGVVMSLLVSDGDL
jgi:hypothetical protein